MTCNIRKRELLKGHFFYIRNKQPSAYQKLVERSTYFCEKVSNPAILYRTHCSGGKGREIEGQRYIDV